MCLSAAGVFGLQKKMKYKLRKEMGFMQLASNVFFVQKIDLGTGVSRLLSGTCIGCERKYK